MMIPKDIPERKQTTMPVGTIEYRARREKGSGTATGGAVLLDSAIGTSAIETITEATAKRVKPLVAAKPMEY
jgi:hypothetical protein|tara:strand:- start:279 stop:494 length:216 start_codon:yes stop_codon:yes gene_type:complete